MVGLNEQLNIKNATIKVYLTISWVPYFYDFNPYASYNHRKNYKIQGLLKFQITEDCKEWLVIARLLFKYPQNISYCFKINKEINGFQKNIQE